MKRLLFLAIPLLLTTVLHGAEPLPGRIISLAPSATQGLYDLGVEEKVIGITVYCPPGTLPKERIGTLWEPNIERIVSLSPDVVIISKEGNRKSVAERLRKLGITLYIMENDRSFDDICRHFLELGKLVGREERAREIVSGSRERVERVAGRIGNRRPVRVFWEIGANPLFTISKNSFVEDFNRFAGGINIFADLSSRFPQISREEVIRRDPEAILLVTMGDVTKHEHTYWRKFKDMRAVRDARIYVIQAGEIFTPNPTTFARGVELVAELLHPAGRQD